MKKQVFLFFFFLTPFMLLAQDKWSLRQCVEYALLNNISIKQADLQSRFSALQFNQNKLEKYPTLGFQGNSGYRFGRSENPTTGVLEDNNFLSSGFNLTTGVNLFNWFAIKYGIEASKLSYEADKAQTKKVQDDVALNVAVAYLQALLAKAQINISEVRVRQTASQYELTSKQVKAGSLPELNAAELESQLATDSSNLISAQTLAQQYLLQLKALLNLDAAAAFDIETPPADQIPVESLADLEPEKVYELALNNLSQQKVNNLRLQSSFQSVKAARSNMYPSLSLFGSLGSNYVNIAVPQYTIGAKRPTGASVNINGLDYDVLAPAPVLLGQKSTPLFRQLRNNFGQSVGISINAPIFNNGLLRTTWERSKLTVQQWQLQTEQDNQTLKQNIYKAYTDAVAAIQKFNASSKAVKASEKAASFAQKRYNLNLVSTYDLINSQNNLLQAQIEMLSSQFDYIFKLKLLEFYKGQGLKL